MYVQLMTFVAGLLGAASAAGCLYLFYAAATVRRFAALSRSGGGTMPPISVLKPLCGGEPGLYENLASLCRQDYSSWQVIFGVQDPGDPAIAVVRRLIKDFPEADIDLVVDSTRHGGNLKVANLLNMLPKARHDIIFIADSDMRVTPDYLAEVSAPLAEPATGLVTCLYRGRAEGGIWSQLGCSHINHGFLPQALVAQTLGERNGCFGATLALRRETLQAAGGLAAIADALADDHALGAAVRNLGLTVVLSSYIVDNVVAEASLKALFRHELRWARTIRMIAPAGYFGSMVTQPVALALAAFATGVMPLTALGIVAVALGCRSVMVRMVDRALRLPPTPLWLIPARDLLSFAVFVASFFARTVAWRDREFRIGPEGRLIPGRR